MTVKLSAELIVLAAPHSSDPYYEDVLEDIINFQIAFAKKASRYDDVLVLTDQSLYQTYAKALGPDKVFINPVNDIWMRDIGLVNPTKPFFFRYTAEGQGGGKNGQREADKVQQTIKRLAISARLKFTSSLLLNDGGNFVDDYEGNQIGRAHV